MNRPTVRVFISGPYSTGDHVENMRAALDAAEQCLDAGLVPFVPHLGGFWHFVYPHEYEAWMAYDFAWLELCDLVLRLPGESYGADREVDLARHRNIPVFYSVEEVEAFVDRVFPRRRYVTPEREGDTSMDVCQDDETDGQLCPYSDCSRWCGLAGEGWYECPHCERLFYACPADGDYEDYHCYPESAEHPHPPEGTPIAIAVDRGPSWASEPGE